ncbi:MAG: hypothetical protein HUK23_00430 [Sphaerochaetaceae bacterium]|nr:hypothetical protein [Sphaerochaetaceae bacterium]
MKIKRISILLFIVLSLCLFVGCNSNTVTCYYGYFEDHAYAFVYQERNNTLYGIRLPLEQVLLWGKASNLDSIPTAMKNYVGLNDSGFLIGTAASLQTVSDLLDALGSESEEPVSSAKRLVTMVDKADVLTTKPLSTKIGQLCGQDALALLKLIAEKKPQCFSYDAHSFFTTEDLNFSQRYFSQWLNQVLGGEI